MNDDKLYGGKGDDWLDGGKCHDKLYGGDGHDKLYGGKGNDWLYGDDGHDKLYGGKGDDKLYGGKGDDWLDGGKGNDHLYGGEGYDKFVFSDVKHNGYDVIHDFNPHHDKLVFSLKDLEYATHKDLNKRDFEDYIAINDDGKAKDHDDYIVYDSDNGKLYFDYDGSGHGHAVQLATLVGEQHLDDGDFYLAA